MFFCAISLDLPCPAWPGCPGWLGGLARVGWAAGMMMPDDDDDGPGLAELCGMGTQRVAESEAPPDAICLPSDDDMEDDVFLRLAQLVLSFGFSYCLVV